MLFAHWLPDKISLPRLSSPTEEPSNRKAVFQGWGDESEASLVIDIFE